MGCTEEADRFALALHAWDPAAFAAVGPALGLVGVVGAGIWSMTAVAFSAVL
jgi:hypothetical protein